MTEAEAWDSLAEHLKQKNYTGALVLADWFQENGKEKVAVYLRWASKRGFLPSGKEGYWWKFYGVGRYWQESDVEPKHFAICVQGDAEELADLKEFYSD